MQPALISFAGALAGYPVRTLFGWYAGLIGLGTVLLLLPACRAAGAAPFSLTDALFTAASAACVTGLMVISAANDLSLTGQVVVLVLIQLGGLGIMSIATLLFVSVTGRQPVHYRLLTRDTLGAPLDADLKRLLGLVVLVTLSFEAAGAIGLVLARAGDGPWGELVWWAVFHSVSAFCNAGITLQESSLAPWAGDPGVVLLMAALIVSGGFGFPVLLDLLERHGPKRDRRHLGLHTRMVVAASALFVLLGATAFWLIERDGELAQLGLWEGLLGAFFQSVTARTAGFSTLEVASLSNATLFLLMGLMFVGAAPCSTGGGVKVTTISILLLQGHALLRRRWQTAAFGRRVPDRLLATASVVVAVQGLLLLTGLWLLLVFEQSDLSHAQAGGEFTAIVFEAFSALGTVGLSTGITASLGEPSRLVLVAMMLCGRVGPLVLASVLLRGPSGPNIRYPEGEMIIG